MDRVDAGEVLAFGQRRGRRVRRQQQGVVVEHLLEVGHQPPRVGRVAGEAPGELVVDPTARHGVERLDAGRQRVGVTGPGVAVQQPLDRHRLGELRGSTEPAELPVPRLGEDQPRGLVGDRRVHLRSELGVAMRFQRRGDRGRGLEDLSAPLGPRVGDRLDHLRERRHAVTWLLRPVGPRVERPARRG
jgi:hypothetical protein